MGIGESIMKMFQAPQTAAPATPAPGAPTTPGNIPPGTGIPATTTTTGTAPNGVVPEPGTKPTPFEAFKDLWENKPADPNAPEPQKGVFGTIDPQKFMEAAGKIDFGKIITPEQLAAIQGGGEGAAKAFAEAMNKVAQSTYAQSAFATTKIVEQALAKSEEQFLAKLPQHIKKQTVTDSLRAENPIFSNPAVQPLIEAMETRFAVKFPNASAPELTKMAKDYIAEIGKSFSPKAKEPKEAKTKSGETDWSKFLD